MPRSEITAALESIFSGIQRLKIAFPHRAFTIDGRLVGDIGEVIAEIDYDLRIDPISRTRHDAVCSDGREVQIKATFQNSLTIRSVPDVYLGFKLFANGEYEEIFNGPGELIARRYGHRKGFGDQLLSFPISELKRLSTQVAANDRIPRRLDNTQRDSPACEV